MAKRKMQRLRNSKRSFKKYANRTNVKNVVGGTMMRGGFHF